MSEFPSLPLFTDAFIADTGHLSATETGAYLMLLMMAWRLPDCRIPDDDAKLARWARVDARAWARIKSKVMEFWTLEDGHWTQKRLLLERDKVRKFADTARANGMRGGRPKSLKSQDQQNPAGSPSETQSKAPNPNPNPIREESSTASPLNGSARAELDRIEAALRSAAGLENDPHPGLLNLAPMLGLLDAGLELERDILPVLRAKARAGACGRTWAYYVEAIRESAQARNGAAQPIPTTAQEPRHGPHRKPSASDFARLDLARIEREERERAGAGPVLRIASG